MQTYFFELAKDLFAGLQQDELCNLNLDGEQTDFVRLNHAKVRQPGTVSQAFVEIKLMLPKSKQQASATMNLTNDQNHDRDLMRQQLQDLRAVVRQCPEDPFMISSEIVASSERIDKTRLRHSADVIDEVCTTAKGLDLVGIYCAGRLYRGFANSLGQQNWFETNSFNLDWSCYLRADQAVKANYAGFEWDSEQFADKLGTVRQQLELLKRPVKAIEPGAYRIYLAPAAMDEILTVFKWGGFSEKAIRTKHSSFARMRDQGLTLAPTVNLTENMTLGVAPGFDRFGFIRPDKTALIERGQLRQGMVSARTSREYDLRCNGAEADEAPCALELGVGAVKRSEILAQLDTGLLINNLWYINYSDRNAGRITGMTRFATFWVENGEIAAPVPVMRFDDSVYQFLGGNLIGFTAERDLCMSPMTYYQRGTTASLLPGALVKDFKLTL